MEARAVVDIALEVAGGAAFYRSSPLERAYRDVRGGPFHPLTPEATLTLLGERAQRASLSVGAARHDHPQHQVDDELRAGQQARQQEHQPHRERAPAEPLREAGAHAGDHGASAAGSGSMPPRAPSS